MTHILPPLPYAMDALLPHISQETLEYHYGKHHQTYVTNLNNLIPGTPYEDLSLEETITLSHTKGDQGIFNNAAQVWNHTFYWHCLSQNGGGAPPQSLMDAIVADFGNFQDFCAQFKQAALTQFGSGWAWLVKKEGKLQILKTGNADLPMVHGATALLTCDVWEHAYYIDYRNKRADYVDVFLNHLVNWSFVEQNWR